MKKVIFTLIACVGLLAGCFETPTDAELIGDFASYVDAQHRNVDDDEGTPITKDSLQFIEKHLDMFVNHDEEASQKLVNPSIDYRHLGKDIEKYSGTMYQDYGFIVDIQEVKDESLNKTFTIIHLNNLNTDVDYDILYIGKTDFLKEDTIQFTGLPLMETRFKNTGGGTTKLFMILASDLKKIE